MQFNGVIAGAFTEAEYRQALRAIDSGERTAGSTAGLVDALEDFRDEIQPWKDAVTNSLNTLAEVGLRILTTALDLLEKVPGPSDVRDWINEMLGRGEGTGTAAFTTMAALRDWPTKEFDDPMTRRPTTPP